MMTINGVSQTSGVQRLVDISPSGEGLRLGIRDRKPGSEWEYTAIAAEALLTVLTEQPKGVQSIPGSDGKSLDVEVRRNEIWLTFGGPDAAVGMDDLMDAVGESLSSA